MLDSYFYKPTPKNLSTLKRSLILIPAKLFNPSTSLPPPPSPSSSSIPFRCLPPSSSSFPPLLGFVNLRKNNSALINRKEIEKIQKRRMEGVGGMDGEGGGGEEQIKEPRIVMGRKGERGRGSTHEGGEEGPKKKGEGGAGQGRKWGRGWGGGEGGGEGVGGKKKREVIKVSFHVESKQYDLGWKNNSIQKPISDKLSDSEIASFKSTTSLPCSNKSIIKQMNFQIRKSKEGRVNNKQSERAKIEEDVWINENRKKRIQEGEWLEDSQKSKENDELKMLAEEGEKEKKGGDRMEEERMTLYNKSGFFQIKNPKLSAKSWVIFDATNFRTMGSKKPRKKREIASLTKIMNCFVVCNLIEKYGLNPKEHFVKVSRAAATLGGTTANLKIGDKISILDLLYGMMLPSGNDASLCLAKFFGKIIYIFHKKKGLEVIKDPEWNKRNKRDWANIFVCEMNKQARKMGLINSSYSNPHGLSDSNNKSTAEDVAKLSSHCLSNSFIKELVSTRNYSATIQNKGKVNYMQWQNTNLLLWKGFTGIKTGLTPAAGPCLSASFKEQGGRDIIIVILRTKNGGERFEETVKLVKWVMKQCQVEGEGLEI